MSTITKSSRSYVKVIILSILALAMASEVFAQRKSKSNRFLGVQREYIGFETTFGVRTFNVSSDITAISNLSVVEEGGAIGFVFGNKMIQSKLRQGYYYSTASVRQTIDVVETEGVINIYPFQFIKTQFRNFEPYFVASLDRNSAKFYGFYNTKATAYNESTTATPNYSVSDAPFLGRVVALRASFGGGLAYHFQGENHFMNIFAEAKYGRMMGSKASNVDFQNTVLSNQMNFNIGVSFGYRK